MIRARLPLLLATAILLLAGGWRVAQAQGEPTGWALLAAGLVCLGAWVATAAIDWHRDLHHRDTTPTEEDA